MKLIFQKIASVVIAFLVLLSTMSFSVEKHYCGDFLVDVSYFGNADSCNMGDDSSLQDDNNCCKDEHYQIDGQDELLNTLVKDISFDVVKIVAISTTFKYDVFSDFSGEKQFYKDYSPPDILSDYQVLYQSFLI